jgi:hypothetical protein
MTPTFIILMTLSLATPAAKTQAPAPSRPAEQHCRWNTITDHALGLEAHVQSCDFGDRKIDFVVAPPSLSIRYSDGGAPYPVVDVLDLAAGETPAAGIERWFRSHTNAKIAERCVLKAYRGSRRAGVERFTFVPNAAYAKELDAQNDADEVGDPPCGDWGDAPDGIQYFEVQPKSGAHKVLFVRVGQDTPLFDENTLTLLKSP